MIQNVLRGTKTLKRASLKHFPWVVQSRSYLEWSNNNHILDSWTSNEQVKRWVMDNISHMQPARVHLCDGSLQEYDDLMKLLTAQGTLIKINDKLRPNSYLARSVKSDVARTEETTFICSESRADCGPTNNWMDPLEAANVYEKSSEICMRGRTMYVAPFCMGPINSPLAQVGIQITDSPLVIAQMRIMTRMGLSVMKMLQPSASFIPCVHTVGQPLRRTDADSSWPCSEKRMVYHYPEQRCIMSYGSGYGGNALLGKKCLALRIASTIGREEGWLAEHMLIIGVTNPAGVKKYIAAAFPSACGKTNMALMRTALPGWKIECLGDDIAWIRLGKDGRFYAINPEQGFFGVAPGTSEKTNPNMMKALRKDVIFINVGLTNDFDVWWEGMTPNKPPLVNWLRKEWKTDDAAQEAAHANSRFVVPLRNCPTLDPNWDDPQGVPLDAIIFGGRRSATLPLVMQSRNWKHGVFMGSVMGSETTAAAAGRRGLLRIDPFAMKPFCGYNMADYFAHWLKMEKRSTDKTQLPKVFSVNWFRKTGNKIVWPGFCENVRVLKWIFERCENAKNYKETEVGLVPTENALDISNLDLSQDDVKFLFDIKRDEWKVEITRYKEFYESFGKDKIPKELYEQLNNLERAFAPKSSKS